LDPLKIKPLIFNFKNFNKGIKKLDFYRKGLRDKPQRGRKNFSFFWKILKILTREIKTRFLIFLKPYPLVYEFLISLKNFSFSCPFGACPEVLAVGHFNYALVTREIKTLF
jgi:hypothetical protein